MISESATGMSNGGRVSSASDGRSRKMKKPIGCEKTNQYRSCASTMPIIESVPACITTAAAPSTSGSS